MLENEPIQVKRLIEDRLDELGAKQRKVGDFVLRNPLQVLFATAAEVAAAAGVDPATVVRFAQGLGFKGYPDFRDALRGEFPMLRSAPQIIEDENAYTGVKENADLQTIVDRVRSRAEANLASTWDRQNARDLGKAVDAFLSAGRVVVVGAGKSSIISSQLEMILQLAGVPTLSINDWYQLIYNVTSFSPDDVFFATTVWHYSGVTLKTLEEARAAGARSFLLTDEAFSPAASLADTTFYYAPKAVGEYLSPLGAVAIIDIFAAILAAREPERVKRGMERQSSIARSHGLTVS